MAEKAKKKYLNTNVYFQGTQLDRGTEIDVDHPGYEGFENDGFLSDSKALAEGKTEALASELDRSEEIIAELQAENETLKKDLGEATKIIAELQKKNKKENNNEEAK